MKKIIFSVLCFIFSINYVSALTLTCPSIASPNETINCQIETDQYIGIKANYELNNNFIYKETKVNNPWKKYYTSNQGISIGNITDNTPLTSTIKLQVSPNLEVNKDYQITLSNIEVVTKDYNTLNQDNITTSIKILSNINTLKNLEVKNHKLTPTYDSDNTSYKVTTTDDTITIIATKTDDLSTITGDVGEQKLSIGTNNFVINVTSQRGETKNYYLYVTRKLNKLSKSSDITLKSLSLSLAKLKFNQNQFLYETNVDYSVENIDITAVPNNNKATISIDKPEKLSIGENIITITVTAEDGTIGKYIIIVNRKEKPSNDSTIKTLNIKGYTINFDSDTYNYQILIKNEKSLDIEVIPNNSKATFKITGNENLTNNSIITITVTAEDNTQKDYKIKVRDKNNS